MTPLTQATTGSFSPRWLPTCFPVGPGLTPKPGAGRRGLAGEGREYLARGAEDREVVMTRMDPKLSARYHLRVAAGCCSGEAGRGPGRRSRSRNTRTRRLISVRLLIPL